MTEVVIDLADVGESEIFEQSNSNKRLQDARNFADITLRKAKTGRNTRTVNHTDASTKKSKQHLGAM